MKWILVSGATAAIAAISAIALADPGNPLVIGKKSASGRGAYAVVVTPHVRATTKIVVTVASHPRQRVSAGYMAKCFIGLAFGRRGKDRTGLTPFSMIVDHDPYDEYCVIVADAKLTKKGRVTVQVIGRP